MRRLSQVGVDLGHPLAGDGRIFLPAGMGQHEIARLAAGMPRGHDAPDRLASHDPADGHRLRVGFGGTHPAAHIGVERQEEVADQNLTLTRFGHGAAFDPEIALDRSPVDRAFRKQYAGILSLGHDGFRLPRQIVRWRLNERLSDK